MKMYFPLQIALIGLISCANQSTLNLPLAPAIPGPWGQLSNPQYSQIACLDISGKYYDQPEVFKTDDESGAISTADRIHLYRLFPFHKVESTQIAIEGNSLEKGEISIQQSGDESITLTQMTKNSEIAEVSEFSSGQGHYSCRNGAIEFPKSQQYGMMEGMNVNSQARVQARKAEDRSLIIIWSKGPLKGRIKGSSADVVHHYYRFERIENSASE